MYISRAKARQKEAGERKVENWKIGKALKIEFMRTIMLDGLRHCDPH